LRGEKILKVDIYIETSSQFQGKVERKCGYVLSTLLRGGEETRKHFGTVSGTYHQAVLLTIADALEHMTRSCKICIHTRDLYVGSRLEKITEMAGAGWMDSKGQPIKNKEEYGLMMNRSEENQNGCREQIRNEDEGIDGILEALGAYVCDELCCHRGENLTQEEMECFCCHCEMQQYTDKIREML
jgi:hypothetical protein